MTFKKTLISTLFAAAFVAGFSGAAQAGVVYDVSTGAPPNFFGGGVVDNNFALSSFDVGGSTVELGLRARYRVRPTQASDGTGLYGPFPIGTQTASHGSLARTDRAEWSYDFYIDSGGANLAGLNFALCIDGGGIAGTQCADPLLIGDNKILGTEIGNSEQFLFNGAGLPNSAGYDVNAHGLYNISLSLLNGANQLGAVAIAVSVVPEPGSLALLGVGLAGLAAVGRKKKKA